MESNPCISAQQTRAHGNTRGSSALVPLPARPNLALDAHIFPYLESSARNHLLRALAAHRDQTTKVHSVLLTVCYQTTPNPRQLGHLLPRDGG